MLLVASAAWAQSRNITGIVFDTDGKSPLVGATVILKGTATGTISNADGTYTIHVGSDNDVLVFQSLGYDPQEVTVRIRPYFVKRCVRMVGNDGIQFFLQFLNFTRRDFNVRSLSLCTAHRLVNHHAGVGQRRTLALGTCHQQHGSHTCRHTGTDSSYIARDELHRIVNTQSGIY